MTIVHVQEVGIRPTGAEFHGLDASRRVRSEIVLALKRALRGPHTSIRKRRIRTCQRALVRSAETNRSGALTKSDD